ncbi:ERG4/ERG24 ergosterol biosynthesis protein [Calocera viscosa TUFC12733]|uniref:Delta(24(24(1)))-sterol reductase n=1 Tax=Calocera viscosa (strain TUFC12733) TaxID=1330018 RepID=A0A167RZE5_CALVF|nr:ERG4/ERG24 ergosterol biosynthesis protein [Calocera viscosa TUFC12733]
MAHDGAASPDDGKHDNASSVRQRKNPILTGDSKAVIVNGGHIVFSELGMEVDKKLDTHQSWEFGGPPGVTAMIFGFPVLMYYLWICLSFYGGQMAHPESVDDIVPFLGRMWEHVKQDAAPTPYAFAIYTGLMAIQLLLAFIMPGYQQEGLPVPSLKYKTLMYNCNALASWYATLIIAAALHLTGTWRLTEIIDNFGSLMTVSMIWANVVSIYMYVSTVVRGEQIRMSGNTIYDFFMGACLNPRIGSVDLKMWAEVRIPWVLLFLIAVSGSCKQYDTFGYVTPNMAFMVLATGLYINACAKGEECIPQTWDMFHEKWGWMIIFWNFSGVPFTYCYSIVYMAANDPKKYEFSTPIYIALYTTLLCAYYVFDSSMSQKSRFRMQMQGTYKYRWTFPQLPWGTLTNPQYIQTEHGNRLLISGWWRFARKPNYSADWIQSLTWGLCIGAASPIPYFYPLFFLAVLTHRCGRDFERCELKYGKDWDKYCSIVRWRFIPGIY